MIPLPLLQELADALWWERHAGERLLLALVGFELIAASGEHALEPVARADLRRAVEELHVAQLLRGVAQQQVGHDRGERAVQLSLSELARSAPSPFGLVFGHHQRALAHLAEDLRRVADAVAHLPGLHSAVQCLQDLVGSVADGRPPQESDEEEVPEVDLRAQRELLVGVVPRTLQSFVG